MRRPHPTAATLVTFVIASFLPFSATLAAQTASPTGPQQFIVLQSQTLTVPFESLTSEQAQCSISGNASFATMRCLAPPGTAKASYHYVAVLVVDQQGMAYVAACHQSLVDFWCKKLPAGVAIQGNFDSAQKSLSILDGQKSHAYQTLTSAFVGPLQPGQPIPSAKRPKTVPEPATPAAAGQTAPTPQRNTVPASTSSATQDAAVSNSKPQPAAPASAAPASNAPQACVPTATSCAAFVSDPPGADIYVDGKFVGSTPSTLSLSPGSHDIRIQADKFKPWTRTLESTAGSTVSIHAALAKK